MIKDVITINNEELAERIIQDQWDEFDRLLDSELTEEFGPGTDAGWCDLTPEQMERDLTETTDKIAKNLMKGTVKNEKEN